MFVYNEWDNFLKKLSENGIHSISADSALKNRKKQFLILKHDVETNPSKALDLARIENKYGHCGVYYVQAYLLNNQKNIEILQKIKDLGHEVSYHHDVMDSNSGNLEKALEEFNKNKDLFENNGFIINTVCQHGNPVAQRNGYTSNRDFFRSEAVKKKFGYIAEIMVDYRKKTNVDFRYISDAGYGWKVIYDPETNDIVDSSDKDIKLENLDKVLDFLLSESAIIISTHPHRWNSNIFNAAAKTIVFKTIRITTRILRKIPFINKIMSKFYFLAKKIWGKYESNC